MTVIEFVAAAAVALGSSWVLIRRLERLAERLGMSEALLGLMAALAADAPEITSAVTALVRRQQAVGSGVVLGSNVFNLAALLGLGAVVVRRVALDRRVVALGGAVALWVALAGGLVVFGVVGPGPGLGLALAVVVPYVVVLATGSAGGPPVLRRHAPRWTAWLAAAVTEEEDELEVLLRPLPGSAADGVVAVGALLLIVSASVVMERSATALGSRYDIAGIVVGAIILAAVTSLPNAVAGVYLATRGRGAAMLSTTLHSNTLNVLLGLLVPAAVVGLSAPSGAQGFIAAGYGVLTAVALAFAYVERGLRRWQGWLVIIGYGTCVVVIAAWR